MATGATAAVILVTAKDVDRGGDALPGLGRDEVHLRLRERDG